MPDPESSKVTTDSSGSGTLLLTLVFYQFFPHYIALILSLFFHVIFYETNSSLLSVTNVNALKKLSFSFFLFANTQLAN
jgi:hypothetical protein